MMNQLNLKLNNKERFLCAILQHVEYLDQKLIQGLYKEIGDQNLFYYCSKNNVNSIAAHALKVCFNSKIPGHWLEELEEVDQRISSYMDELESAAILLSKYGIPLVALKNSGITLGIYPHYGACPMGDIDVMVRKSDFRKAHEVLLEKGYKMKFRSPLEEDNIDKAEQGGGAEYSVILPNGQNLWFELQWRPVAGRWIRPDQEPSGNKLMDRSIEIKGSSVRLLAPEDNLLQVCLHTAKHSYVRAPGFRLHTDVDRIVRSINIDWSEFVKIVCELQVKTATFFSLSLSNDLLNTPIPDSVFFQLRPSKWKVWLVSRWLQKVGLFDPDGSKWNRLSYIVFVSLLYDTISGLLRGIIPTRKWMMKHYAIKSNYALPFYYVFRLIDLVLKRTLNK